MPGPEHGSPATKLETVAVMWRNLSSSEKETLKEKAEKNKLANKAAFESWIETYTPHQIRDANRARRYLNRVIKQNLKLLKDHREPQYPITPYLRFLVEQHHSGEFDSIKDIKERTAHIAEAWKTAPEWKKQARPPRDMSVQTY
ncbi:unnamed protein product [Penicillium salamii]|uniref:HMG box domain-containing protein n=1 Tax=Penicillium salamii TaxID=1612424 RepID=A0A9W4JW28_9EURO|nr:unnamed protein product [Penicillium salamii]CAG7960168.1 unnamed protein product [Penicillium salamii]CAG8272171.1 unnamed protein product [Penicillium salamii]CAG8384960.1 unnamed protein product [Penicillium salamii]CAG8396803.1 unnamed protein product [Penicillium salamii]